MFRPKCRSESRPIAKNVTLLRTNKRSPSSQPGRCLPQHANRRREGYNTPGRKRFTTTSFAQHNARTAPSHRALKTTSEQAHNSTTTAAAVRRARQTHTHTQEQAHGTSLLQPTAVSPRLELPTRDTLRGDDLFEHSLVRRLPGQEVSLVQQTPAVGPTIVVVHACRTATRGERGREGGSNGWARKSRCG